MHEAEKYLKDATSPNRLKVQLLGRTRTLFLAQGGGIGILSPGKRNRGRSFCDWKDISKIYYPEAEAEKQKKMVAKFKKLASKATFTNPFIRSCLKADESKTLYENNLSTGCKIEGEVISLSTIRKIAGSYEVDAFLNALSEKRKYSSGRFQFKSYEGTLSVSVASENSEYFSVADVCGYFSKEYKDCLNGYYYLLINNDSFIGNDVD